MKFLNPEVKQKHIELCRKVAGLPPEKKAELSAKLVCPVTTEGHQLSSINTILLAFQGLEHPTVVAGYQQWRKAGRQVSKGQHGYAIRFPVGQKNNPDEQDPQQDIFFLWTTVFDISQTEELLSIIERISHENIQTI